MSGLISTSKEPCVTPGVTDVLLRFLAFLLVLLHVCVLCIFLKIHSFVMKS